MVRLVQAWRYWIQEPLIWLLYCYFQPARFNRDFETRDLSGRLLAMLRLSLPMFLCAYPLALVVRILIYILVPSLFQDYTTAGHVMLEQGAIFFVFDATWAVAASCFFGGLFGGLFGIVYGVSLGMATAIASGIIVHTESDTFVGITFGLTFGLILGLTFNSLGAIKRIGVWKTTIGIMSGIFVGIIIGVATGILGGFWAGVVVGTLGGAAMQVQGAIEGSVAGLIIGGLSGCILLYMISAMVKVNIKGYVDLIDVGTRIGIVVAGAFGASVGVPVGDVGMLNGATALMEGIRDGKMQGLIVGLAFFASYLVCYYRLPFYPLSVLSMARAYFFSQKYPLLVFHYLRHCVLHWDESVFLPLPYLKQILLLSTEQSLEVTLEEISFILQERPQQRAAALTAVLEISLYDLSMRESLRDISRAYLRLAHIFPQEFRLIDPQIAKLFRYLEDASRDAASYYSRIDWQARHEALEGMIANLKKVFPTTSFRDAVLNRQLEDIVQKWRVVARHEQENVKRVSGSLGRIENPFTPGLVLELHNPLFVGRDELAQQLGAALRRSRRPTFFLTGERRMGKSSILKQLPSLLGSQYLPVFYDLQSTGVASSTAALLATIAEGIYELLLTKGMLVKNLDYEQLREDQRENEAVAYHRFDRWLRDVERVLEREDRFLLLAFDEFEKLEEAGQHGYLDLRLLLDWFRSVIQNRPRLRLLFSGVKVVSDMGSNWAGYFVNVETLKVSFLRLEEAHKLITHPVPDFSGEFTFGEQVVAEVIRQTSGHPFLVQALCSNLIVNLNYQSREQAEMQDVAVAVEEMFDKWGEYFWDLWERTDQEQRACLLEIRSLCECDFAHIKQISGLNEQTAHRAVQRLLRRDLLITNADKYQIAIPLFSQWLERVL